MRLLYPLKKGDEIAVQVQHTEFVGAVVGGNLGITRLNMCSDCIEIWFLDAR